MLPEYLKELYKTTDSVKLELYLEKVILKIRKYLNRPDITNEKIINNFPTAIKVAVGDEIENSKHKNIKSFKEGDQSISYENASNSLSNEVKELLPTPSIRLL